MPVEYTVLDVSCCCPGGLPCCWWFPLDPRTPAPSGPEWPDTLYLTAQPAEAGCDCAAPFSVPLHYYDLYTCVRPWGSDAFPPTGAPTEFTQVYAGSIQWPVCVWPNDYGPGWEDYGKPKTAIFRCSGLGNSTDPLAFGSLTIINCDGIAFDSAVCPYGVTMRAGQAGDVGVAEDTRDCNLPDVTLRSLTAADVAPYGPYWGLGGGCAIACGQTAAGTQVVQWKFRVTR